MKSIRLLSIGNSFSDDMQQYMYDIFKENGYETSICNLYVGGCTLKRHYDNIKNDTHEYAYKVYDKNGFHEVYDYAISDCLKEKWDIITLQQASYESGDKTKFIDIETGENYVNLIHDWFMENYENYNEIRWIYHATWSYDKDFKGDTFRIYDYSQEKMERGMIDCLNKYILYNPIFESVIPNFYSIKILRDDYHINPYRDGFHLSFDLGRYLAGFIACMTIIKDVPHRPKTTCLNITKEEKRLCREIAHYLKDHKDDLYIM